VADTTPVVQVAAAQSDVNLGGGFIEFLFNGGGMAPRPPSAVDPRGEPVEQQTAMTVDPHLNFDPKFQKQVVDYRGSEPPGTIIIDTPNRFLFLVQDNGKAIRYGIGVGKPGFTWAGEKKITAKREWPDWTPPAEMLQRRPDLPHFMAGGPENPLGARAMYLGSTLYRIHGSNEPWTIGHAVSSGCIRMRNEDVIDLYDKVKVGTKVMVI
jgi:lipoprotein-anchoring transpeptidase ErfK/SrfK